MSDEQKLTAPVEGEWLVPAPWAKWSARTRANVIVALRQRAYDLFKLIDDPRHGLEGMHGIVDEAIAAAEALRQLERAICPEGEIHE